MYLFPLVKRQIQKYATMCIRTVGNLQKGVISVLNSALNFAVFDRNFSVSVTTADVGKGGYTAARNWRTEEPA